ncbi:hypothetical protein RRG08_066456 [Elysia crispata]|uniref:Uncharacterized protein n=1 Tax=Elysia crispata TaxID=231223 RepID=A0AAE0Z9L4_9GAST|nr:hypothetical protein RRG08_066456 [Elysia crispata]
MIRPGIDPGLSCCEPNALLTEPAGEPPATHRNTNNTVWTELYPVSPSNSPRGLSCTPSCHPPPPEKLSERTELYPVSPSNSLNIVTGAFHRLSLREGLNYTTVNRRGFYPP